MVKYNGNVLHLGSALGKPYTELLGEGLLEIRARGKEGIGRSLCCTPKGKNNSIVYVNSNLAVKGKDMKIIIAIFLTLVLFIAILSCCTGDEG